MSEPKRILFVSQQIFPYLDTETPIRLQNRQLPEYFQSKGFETRTFMPKFGEINERRNQLHEVIRLSGINLIIAGTDHPLLIKVASIQSARIQIYFIDNDDYFHRRKGLLDAEGNECKDNDERAIFFARGVLETVKKLQWRPSVVHCHGWFSAIAPIYLRNMFKDDPLLGDSKIVVSVYEDKFSTPLNPELAEKLVNEGAPKADVEKLEDTSYENLMRFVIDNVDGVVAGSEKTDKALLDYARESGKKVLDYCSPETEGFFDNYDRFYEELF